MVLEEAYFIGREALINALTHSEGLNVEVEITYGVREFCLRIRDDGRGMDGDLCDKGGRDGHWGIQGMRERAIKIGADLKLWSRPGSGSEIDLTVPAKTLIETPDLRHPKVRPPSPNPPTLELLRG